MTISSSVRTAGPFTGTGFSVAYPFSFKIFQASDLLVVRTDTGLVQSTLALGTDYTVSLNANQNASPGGSVTLLIPLPAGYTLTLTSAVPQVQPLSLTNAGGFFPANIEDEFDRLTILLQQLGFNVSQTLRVPEIGGISTLSAAAARANNLLGFDSLGNPVAVAPSSGSAASLATDLVNSTTAAKGAGQVGYGDAVAYGAGTTGAALHSRAVVVTSIAALRLLLKTGTPFAVVTGYYSVGSGGGGLYYYDSTDTTTADNGGSVIVAGDGGRWKMADQGRYRAKQFGAKGDGATDDTAAITAAYAACKATGAKMVFDGASTFAVTSITFDGSDNFIEFEANSRLKGIAAVSTPAVLQITCRQMQGWNFQVDQNFNANYTKGAIWWNSVNSGVPAQYNRIYGMKVFNCVNGLVYGDVVGGSPVNAAQSENTIFGFTTRACQVPFVGNQPNGFLTLVSPILDCNPNEWTGQGGYNDTTFQTAARCFDNRTVGAAPCHLTIIGGELCKTTSTLGYGMYGGTVVLAGVNVIEIAGTQAYVDGDLTITDCRNWAMTCGGVAASALNAFVIDPSASALAALYMRNCTPSRTTAGSSATSTASFIAAASGSPAMPITIVDCNLLEWRWDSTVPLVSGCVLQKFDNNFVTVNTRGANTVKNITPVVVAAATVTILAGDVEILAAFAGTVTATLPAAASFPGRYLRFSNVFAQLLVSATSNVLPLGGTGAGTAILAATSGKWCEMQSDGTNWRILRAN